MSEGDTRTRQARVGARGEDLACARLRDAGYAIVERGYRTREGEIDIVARDGETTVFVEVKTRSGSAYGGPLAAVTPAKQAKVCRAAIAYLQANDLWDAPCRFDVIGILTGRAEPSVTHVQNAFTCDESI
ncbi:YraN family protein [Candidatus Poribacteria bacterium]|nr:YraN family protein [Candidatus Poribacteria bacterium]